MAVPNQAVAATAATAAATKPSSKSMLGFRDKAWMAAALGAAGGLYFGDQDEDFTTRASKGALAGAALSPLLDWNVLKESTLAAGSLVKNAADLYGLRMATDYTLLRKGGIKPLKAAVGAYGRLPVLMGAGAALGAAIDTDDRKRGAMIGAGAGIVARAAITGPAVWRRLTGTPLRKGLTTVGLSSIAYAAGAYFGRPRPSAEAVIDSTGSNGYAAMPAGYSSGVKQRLANLSATGDVVLGAHARRHG